MFVFSFEFVLLNYKYNLFSGGFLQPFSYISASSRVEFLFFSLIFDAFFYFGLAALWGWFFSRKAKKPVLTSLYYFFSMTLVMGIVIAAKYQLLSYFSDTVNLLILKNLAGGSLQSAMLYAGNEVALAVIAVVITLLFILFLLKKVKYSAFILNSPGQQVPEKFDSKVTIAAIISIVCFSWYSINDASLRYGLSKKISFAMITTSLNFLSDIDFDGYGSFSTPFDTSILDKKIYPGAIDIPNNGVDEDGLLGDAPVFDLEIDHLAGLTFSKEKGKHIIFIVVESARADLVDKKIAGQYVAPNIKKLADTGTSFKQAYSHTGYTTSSLKAIFNRQLSEQHRKSFVDTLRDLNYQLSFISGQDESFGGVADDVGMNKRGNYLFDARTAIDDRVYASKAPASLRLSEERVVKDFFERSKTLDFTQSQFIYLNFQAAHFPYSHKAMKKTFVDQFIPRSKITLDNKEWLEDTYWNAIASADWAVGEVVEYFEQLGMSDAVMFVVLGDHGESLFDHGFLGHGHANNDVQTQIPLILSLTNIDNEQVVGQIDVAEITLRAAFNLPSKNNQDDIPVFQLVGSLKSPVHISHVFSSGRRITFDFRTEQVYVSELAQWFGYKELLLVKDYGNKTKSLILHWEYLRWADYHSNLKG